MQGKLFDSTITDEGTWTLGNNLHLKWHYEGSRTSQNMLQKSLLHFLMGKISSFPLHSFVKKTVVIARLRNWGSTKALESKVNGKMWYLEGSRQRITDTSIKWEVFCKPLIKLDNCSTVTWSVPLQNCYFFCFFSSYALYFWDGWQNLQSERIKKQSKSHTTYR